MTDKEAMAKELEELAGRFSEGWHEGIKIDASDIMLLSQAAEALADPMREVQRLGQEIEQESICPKCKAKVLYECVACSSNNYPPQRTWVGLTDEDLSVCDEDGVILARYWEAKLKQKNGYAEENT